MCKPRLSLFALNLWRHPASQSSHDWLAVVFNNRCFSGAAPIRCGVGGITVVAGNRGTIKDEVARLRDTVLHQAGLMGAMEATILSMANVHADREALRVSLENSFEVVESILLGESPSETTLRAFQQARGRIARAIG